MYDIMEVDITKFRVYHALLESTKSFANFYYDNPKHYGLQQLNQLIGTPFSSSLVGRRVH